MGIGPPRFGLRPAFGRYPGSFVDDGIIDSPSFDARTPAEDLFPGFTLFPFARYIKQPSLTIFPGTDLIISTMSVTVEDQLQIQGFGRPRFLVANVRRSAVLSIVSTSRVGFSYILPSEAARKMGVKVRLASASNEVVLTAPKLRVKLHSVNEKVYL